MAERRKEILRLITCDKRDNLPSKLQQLYVTKPLKPNASSNQLVLMLYIHSPSNSSGLMLQERYPIQFF